MECNDNERGFDITLSPDEEAQLLDSFSEIENRELRERLLELVKIVKDR